MSSEQLRMIFAKNLNRILEERTESQIDVANALGIKQSTFSSWCTGTKFPRVDKIDMLASYFNIERTDLLTEKTAPRLNLSQDAADKLDQLLKMVGKMSPEEWNMLMSYADLILSAQQGYREDQ